MTPHLESAAVSAKAAWAFGTAGFSALGALGSRLLGDSMPPGTERLLDLGFAGIFILALLWGMRVQWLQRIADQAKADTREEKLIALVNEKEKRMNELEREFREGLRNDLQSAEASRREMIELMKGQRDRDKFRGE